MTTMTASEYRDWQEMGLFGDRLIAFMIAQLCAALSAGGTVGGSRSPAAWLPWKVMQKTKAPPPVEKVAESLFRHMEARRKAVKK